MQTFSIGALVMVQASEECAENCQVGREHGVMITSEAGAGQVLLSLG